MTSNNARDQARHAVWQELRRFALPDSRFSWDFREFIPDYLGSDSCADQIRAHSLYRDASVIFVTPDNNLERLRRYVMEDNKLLLMTNYGIRRGFFLVEPGSIPPEHLDLAATLDGVEKFNRAISLNEMKLELGSVDLLVTGASAITTDGLRFGKGHGFFDLEWAMFWETGLVSDSTPVFAVGHDCQVVDIEIAPTPYDTVVDYIVTPSSLRRVVSTRLKPKCGIIWSQLEPEMIESIPPLAELRELGRRTE